MEKEVIDSDIVYMSQIKYKTIDRIFNEKGNDHEEVFMKFDKYYPT